MGRFEEYLTHFETAYPELNFIEKERDIIIEGRIRIIDSVGEEWDNFDIKIIIPSNYPKKLPIVFETSDKLEKKIGNHFFENESCCLGWWSELHLKLQGNYSFSNFIEKVVIPFFKQQVYKDYNEGKFVNELTKHNVLDGLTFYMNLFETDKWRIALLGLGQASTRRKANDLCFCFKIKNKKCRSHEDKVMALRKYCGKDLLRNDFMIILEELIKTNKITNTDPVVIELKKRKYI